MCGLRYLRLKISAPPFGTAPYVTPAELPKNFDKAWLGPGLQEFLFVVPRSYYVAFRSRRKEEGVDIGYGWKGFVRSVHEVSRYCIQEYPDDTVIYCSMGTGGIS